jgi:hypothetical protein
LSGGFPSLHLLGRRDETRCVKGSLDRQVVAPSLRRLRVSLMGGDVGEGLEGRDRGCSEASRNHS